MKDKPRFSRWLREPLVHFLLLGAALFALYALVGDSPNDRADRIVVSAGQVDILAEGFARTWQRPPTPDELAGLVDQHVREEILYREAKAMGLDRDDTIVRRRLRQKLEFLANDIIGSLDPSAEELEPYLVANPDKFRVAGRVSFDHVYFNRDRRGEAAADDARRMLARLAEAEAERGLEDLGDRLPLPRRYREAPLDGVASRFGAVFVEQLLELPLGDWTGPVESGFGLHLVRVRALEAGRLPQLAEVRSAVEREWRADRRVAAQEAFYQSLLERYEVMVEERVSDAAANAISSDVGPGR